MTNEEIVEIQRDAITTGTGGQMSAEELTSFIESGVEQNTVIQDEFQVQEVTASEMNIDVIEVASRLLRKVTEGTEVTTKSGISIPRRTLRPTEVYLWWQITDKFLRRNITRQQAAELINKMFSKRAMGDLLDLGINGDDSLNAVAEPFLSIMDGILVKIAADDDVVEVDPFNQNDKMTTVFQRLIDGMPNDFAGDETLLRIYLSPKNYRKYLRELEERDTPLGDQVIAGSVTLPYEGVKLVKISSMPDTKLIHTLTKNFVIGYGLNATVESERNIKSAATDYVLRLEADCNYAISKAIVVTELG